MDFTAYSKEQLCNMSLDELICVRAQWLSQLEPLLEDLADAILHSDNAQIHLGRREVNYSSGGLKMRATEIDSTFVEVDQGTSGFATTWWVSVRFGEFQVAEYRVLVFLNQPPALEETENTFVRPLEIWIKAALEFVKSVKDRHQQSISTIESQQRNRLLQMLAG